MKVLLLGEGGYLGRKVLTELTKLGCKTVAPRRAECDLEQPRSLLNFVRKYGHFDLVVNCAVFQLTGDSLVTNQSEIFIKNTKINQNFLELVSAVKRKMHIVTVGASCAFSTENGSPNYFNGAFHPSVACFASTKRQLAQILSFNDHHSWAVFVPGTLIGPGEQLAPSKKHFFNGTIFRASRTLKYKTVPFEVFGNMSAVREVSSAAKGCIVDSPKIYCW